MPIVVDTSVAIKWVMTEEYTDNAEALLDDHQRRNDPIYVPSLFLYEAANVLFRFVRGGILSMDGCTQAIGDLTKLVHPLMPDPRMIIRALMIADALQTENTHDAQFLALAERTRSTFWTADGRFYRAVGKRITDLATTIKMIENVPLSARPDHTPSNPN